MTPCGVITLLTDFGLEGPYAAVLKGVILSIYPEARIVDITHGVPPGSVLQAALLLQESLPFFPEGTVHLTVVDPGVGSRRRPIAVKTDDRFLVGPDNGIFWPMIAAAESPKIVHLTDGRFFLAEISATFHGRDIFAPVAAHLARGCDFSSLGRRLEDPIRLHVPEPREERGVLIGEVLRVDRFGNLITNIGARILGRFLRNRRPLIRVGALVLEGVDRTYLDKGDGEVLALIGSNGRLEISVNRGRACDRAAPGGPDLVGAEVRISRSRAR